MTNETINQIFQRVRSGTERFDILYEATRDQRKINGHKVRQQGGTEHDATEIFDDALLDFIYTDKPPDCVVRALNKRLYCRRNNLIRDRQVVVKHESVMSTYDKVDEDGNEVPLEIPDVLAEEEMLRKEADHRQVIDSLIRDGNPDATTTAIVTAIMFAPPSATRNEIAKSIGVHHEVFKRQLSKLARSYDERRFGDYRDYLAV